MPQEAVENVAVLKRSSEYNGRSPKGASFNEYIVNKEKPSMGTQGKLGSSFKGKSVDQGGSSKLFESFAHLKENKKRIKEAMKHQRKGEENLVKDSKPEDLQRVLEEYEQFYIEEYGEFLEDVPESIINSPAYASVTPSELLSNISLFNLDSSHSHLFWLPRMYLAIPLPDGWIETQSPLLGHCYFSAQEDKRFGVRPCYLYITNLISKLKTFFGENRQKLAYQKNIGTQYFRDDFGREYRMDVQKMIRNAEEARRLPPEEEESPEKTKENGSLTFKNWGEASMRKEKVLKYDQIAKNPNFRDIHILAIGSQLKLELMEDVRVVSAIHDFLMDNPGQKGWMFRKPHDNDFYWVHHETQRAVRKYPLLEELNQFIMKKLEENKINKEDPENFKNLDWLGFIMQKQSTEEALKEAKMTARSLVQAYLPVKKELDEKQYQTLKQMQNEPSAKHASIKMPKITDFIKTPFSLKEFSENIKVEIVKKDIYDILFHCAFDLKRNLKGSKNAYRFLKDDSKLYKHYMEAMSAIQETKSKEQNHSESQKKSNLDLIIAESFKEKLEKSKRMSRILENPANTSPTTLIKIAKELGNDLPLGDLLKDKPFLQLAANFEDRWEAFAESEYNEELSDQEKKTQGTYLKEGKGSIGKSRLNFAQNEATHSVMSEIKSKGDSNQGNYLGIERNERDQRKRKSLGGELEAKRPRKKSILEKESERSLELPSAQKERKMASIAFFEDEPTEKKEAKEHLKPVDHPNSNKPEGLSHTINKNEGKPKMEMKVIAQNEEKSHKETSLKVKKPIKMANSQATRHFENESSLATTEYNSIFQKTEGSKLNNHTTNGVRVLTDESKNGSLLSENSKFIQEMLKSNSVSSNNPLLRKYTIVQESRNKTEGQETAVNDQNEVNLAILRQQKKEEISIKASVLSRESIPSKTSIGGQIEYQRDDEITKMHWRLESIAQKLTQKHLEDPNEKRGSTTEAFSINNPSIGHLDQLEGLKELKEALENEISKASVPPKTKMELISQLLRSKSKQDVVSVISLIKMESEKHIQKVKKQEVSRGQIIAKKPRNHQLNNERRSETEGGISEYLLESPRNNPRSFNLFSTKNSQADLAQKGPLKFKETQKNEAKWEIYESGIRDRKREKMGMPFGYTAHRESVRFVGEWGPQKNQGDLFANRSLSMVKSKSMGKPLRKIQKENETKTVRVSFYNDHRLSRPVYIDPVVTLKEEKLENAGVKGNKVTPRGIRLEPIDKNKNSQVFKKKSAVFSINQEAIDPKSRKMSQIEEQPNIQRRRVLQEILLKNILESLIEKAMITAFYSGLKEHWKGQGSFFLYGVNKENNGPPFWYFQMWIRQNKKMVKELRRNLMALISLKSVSELYNDTHKLERYLGEVVGKGVRQISQRLEENEKDKSPQVYKGKSPRPMGTPCFSHVH